jgi:hypothetical protein
MKLYPDFPDPEVPDNIMAVLIPALKVRGVESKEIAKVGSALTSLGDPSTGKAAATLNETLVTAENETILENLGDIGEGVLSLNPKKTVEGIADLFDDFLSGGGFF